MVLLLGMGAWGVGPTDSDNAAEWLSYMSEPLEKRVMSVLRRKPTPANADALRAAAWLVLEANHMISWPAKTLRQAARLARERMEALLENKAWIEGWEPEARRGLRASVRAQIRALERFG